MIGRFTAGIIRRTTLMGDVGNEGICGAYAWRHHQWLESKSSVSQLLASYPRS